MTWSLEDRYGYPWTASTPLGWIVLILTLSGGIALWILALYLSVWVLGRGRSSIPLASFGLIVGMSILSLFGNQLNPCLVHSSSYLSACEWVFTVAYLVGTFSLRHEIIAYARRQGFVMKINPLFTFCFSVVYLNYCLNPVRFEHIANSPIELNLNS